MKGRSLDDKKYKLNDEFYDYAACREEDSDGVYLLRWDDVMNIVTDNGVKVRDIIKRIEELEPIFVQRME